MYRNIEVACESMSVCLVLSKDCENNDTVCNKTGSRICVFVEGKMRGEGVLLHAAPGI